ncbi:uncharacterized protein [Oryza sativa Japonica Group]|uniref:Os07g0107900 protein n=3 Tax=Oryza sativa TaxID=4530 RepID=A3BFU5_ORYSJ|nr:serine/arginine repetitive matrix protein 1 [Oryza sativa Japonica Group]EAZ02501.1 hypothetical protein OsI_24606 [Oryza sativa Indica Group]KAB8104056.1 hypothetical protein EE612_036696 [Oryza sativa]EAZ38434.1 hypothetical protein OsJ_22812 [Oryza sativa Japonica Group]KAB8104057.1 hypothetical protein EE612_036696 [Oryza sativa]KAF2921103.1 hypothetical protein DAI22_07g005100 [Oryza sativa Japonica Group]|eukprot:NP_001058712.1 Os07g0107900 [Oryza sativa Japonica Group]
MKSKSSRKAADEDEAKSKKLRSSRGKQRPKQRRRGRCSSTSSRSESPPRKRSKKLKVSDKKSTKNKGRRRHHSLSPSPSPSSSSVSYSTRSSSGGGGGASERSVSPPRRSRSRDVRKKKKERGRDSKRVRRSRRSTSYSTSGESNSSSRSRSRSNNSKSRNRKSGGNKDHASRNKIVQDYDNGHAHRAENVKSVEIADRDEKAMADTSKGSSIEISHSIIDHEKNESVEKMESAPTKDADETQDILPAGSGSPDAQDLELILRQKALENFRKFRGAALMAGKPQTNGTGKEVVTDSPKSSDTKIAEASSVDKPFQRQRSGLSVNCSVGSPRLEDFGNHITPRKQESSAGKSVGVESPGTFEAGSTSGRTEQKGSSLEPTRSNSQIRLQDGRSSSSIMHRLGSPPRSSASVIRRLGSSAGVNYVNGNPRVRSVVSIPTKEGLDSGTSITTPSACDNSPPVENISEVRHPPIDTNKIEGTKGDERNSGEASAPNVSTLSTGEVKDQPGTEVKDGSQFEKKTFSRMHEGETVQVSYKVYIPKKSPALARRKLQR